MGLFNPRQWGNGPKGYGEDGNTSKEIQRKIKRLILRRVYPGLRKAEDLDLDLLIHRFSSVTNKRTDNNAAKLYNYVKNSNVPDATTQAFLEQTL